MSGLAQFLLIVVISTLTFLITVVTIQVFKLIQEARLAIRKFTEILNNTQTIADSAARPIAAVNEFFSEVKEMVESTEDQIARAPKKIEPSRHIFRRAGQFLHPTRPS